MMTHQIMTMIVAYRSDKTHSPLKIKKLTNIKMVKT